MKRKTGILKLIITITILITFIPGIAFAAEGTPANPSQGEPTVTEPSDENANNENANEESQCNENPDSGNVNQEGENQGNANEFNMEAPEDNKIEIVDADTDFKVGKPRNLVAKIKSTKIVKLDWDKASNAEKYIIYKDKKKIKTVKKTSFTVKKLKKNKKYTFKVKAVSHISGEAYYGKAAAIKVKTPKKITMKMKEFSFTNAAKIINIAKSKLRCKYVLGAAGAKKFDCSGYVYYCYKKSGIRKFKRTTAQGIYYKLRKYYIGRSLKKAQPGDIILCGGSKRSISHVAMYYGGGKIIHAANPRKNVCISSARHFHIVGIIRVPNL